MNKKRVTFRADDSFIEELNEILEDINSKNPNKKEFGVKNIVWNFMKDYAKTQPYGLIWQNKRINERLDEIAKEMEDLEKEKNELLAKYKLNEGIINNKKLDDYKDKYTLQLEEAKKDYLKRANVFGDKIDKNEILEKVLEQYPEIRKEDLLEILQKNS